MLPWTLGCVESIMSQTVQLISIRLRRPVPPFARFRSAPHGGFTPSVAHTRASGGTGLLRAQFPAMRGLQQALLADLSK